jgi:sister-chromatid-cohesion protein PDS5
MVAQLSGLGEITGPYLPYQLYLLESLSTVKSIVLMVDLPHADTLMQRVFSDFFEGIR